ncbi:MAG: GntR family transcriptional regulator [Cyclobacteriaceae bacterium]|nr:MAG: GntR family transcriptional regulator [Cyclobacteriaceae bacterium]
MEFEPTKGIYLQIADSICEKILSNAYSNGDKIPSVRELAAETGVNPNTIMRTYTELQSAGILENRRGVGFFVGPEAKGIILTQRKQQFFNQTLPEFVKQAKLLNISLDDIWANLKEKGGK